MEKRSRLKRGAEKLIKELKLLEKKKEAIRAVEEAKKLQQRS